MALEIRRENAGAFSASQLGRYVENMKKQIILLFLIFSLQFVSGCFWSQDFIISGPSDGDKTYVYEPTLDRYLYRKSTLHYEGFSIDLKPYNAIKTHESFFAFFFVPFYIQIDDRPVTQDGPLYEDNQFVIRISIQNKNKDLSVDLSKTILKVGAITISPSMVRPACHTSIEYVKAYKRYLTDSNQSELLSEGQRRHNICVSDCFNTINVSMHNPATIPSDNLWYCFDVVFDIEAPNPNEHFSLKLTDINIDSKVLSLPVIDFETKKYWMRDSAP